MKKTIKITLILGLALCLILSMALFAACDPKNNDTGKNDEEAKIQYTVSVVFAQDESLSGVTVKLKKADGSLAGEKALEGGKATFELESGDYSVELAGLPEDYSYDAPPVLTKDAPNCTIAVNAPTNYTVTVTYPVMKDIYGATVSRGGPASGVTVMLYEGKLKDDRGAALEGLTPASTATTDNTGTARFKLAGDAYTIVIPEYAHGLEMNYPLKTEQIFVNTVTKSSPYFAVTFSQRYLYGEEETMPIKFELGENNVPLTLELLTTTLEKTSSAFYSFTPEKTANYTFTATGNAKVGGEVFGTNYLFASEPIVVHLEAGTEYLFSCGISSTSGNLAYAIKIEEGGDIDDGGVEAGHAYPWTQGKGTLKDPFTTTTLSGEYTNLYVAAESHFYLAYTPSADETYTFSEIGDNLWLQVYDDVANIPSLSNYLIEVGGGAPSNECELKANKTYYILIGTMNDEADTVGFKAEKKGGDSGESDDKHTYPWKQGEGTLEAPFTTTSLDGEYKDLYIAKERPIFLTYAPTTHEKYTFSEVGNNLWLQVYDDVKNISSRTNYLIEVGGEVTSKECELKANKTYYILIGTMNDEADTVGFKAEKKGGETPPPSTKATYTVTVVGKDSSGNTTPLAGISVTIRDADQTTKTTDAQGKVSFEVAAGSYGILLSKIPSNYRDDNEDLVYAVSPKQPDLTITLTKIENTHKVSVTVKYADGKLAEQGLTVRLVASNNSAFDEKTNANGVATFDVADGEYTVQVPLFTIDGEMHDNGPQLDSGQRFHISKYTVKVNGSDISIEAAYNYTRSVDITVKNADGTPVANRTVDIIDKYDNEYEAETDANGVAHFDNVIEGEYDILVTDKTGGDGKLTVEGGDAKMTLTI